MGGPIALFNDRPSGSSGGGGGSGTVTSVDVSGGTTGLTFSGGPINTSGTLTLSGTLAAKNGGTGQDFSASSGFIKATAGAFSAVSLASSDVGLGNVTNDAQTRAAVMPNTAPTDGQIPIGSTAGGSYTPATITAGSNITVTNGAGSITIAATGGGSGITLGAAQAQRSYCPI